MREPSVGDVMTTLVVTFRLDDLVQEAARRMLANRISGGPVVDQGKVVGVLSEADIARVLLPPGQLDEGALPLHPTMYLLRGGPLASNGAEPLRVRDCMTPDVVSVHPRDGLWTAARIIARRGIKRVPVIDDEGYLAGIVARADIVRAMTQEAAR